MLCLLINRIKKSEPPVKLWEKILNLSVKLWKNYSFAECYSNFAGKRHVSHDVIIAFLKSLRQRWRSWRYHDVKTMAKCPKGIGVTWSMFDSTLIKITMYIYLRSTIRHFESNRYENRLFLLLRSKYWGHWVKNCKNYKNDAFRVYWQSKILSEPEVVRRNINHFQTALEFSFHHTMGCRDLNTRPIS